MLRIVLALSGVAAAHAWGWENITCPMYGKGTKPYEDGKGYHEITITEGPGDAKLCLPVQIRQCMDGAGCVGVKYRNDTTLYDRCGMYGDTQNEDPHALPVTVKIAEDAKYLVFVCDPEPDVLEPTVQEWWPKAGDVTDGKQNWPSTLPPMGGALDCSPYAGDWAPPYDPASSHGKREGFMCPWVTQGKQGQAITHGECASACSDCREWDSFPPRYPIEVHNTQGFSWRLELVETVKEPYPSKKTSVKKSICAFGEGYRGDSWYGWSNGLSTDVQPFSSANFTIPSTSDEIHFVPRYHEEPVHPDDTKICVVLQESFSNDLVLPRDCSMRR